MNTPTRPKPSMPPCAVCGGVVTPGNGRDIPPPRFLWVRDKWACAECDRTARVHEDVPVLVTGFAQLEFEMELVEAYG